MKNKWKMHGLMGLLLLGQTMLSWADYSGHTDARAVVNELVEEEGLDSDVLLAILKQAEKRQSILDAISRPAEKTLTWERYRNIFIQKKRIQDGADFYKKHAKVLQAAEDKFGVPKEIIVSIIGVETLYGKNTGSYRVIDALSTLAFDYPKRSPFFRSELKHFLILTSAQGKDPLTFKGSYAGAMGLGQFMPSSYRAYAAEYGTDGFIDIWEDPQDAIWSVANYLRKHGWQRDQSITRPVTLAGDFNEELISSALKPALSAEQLVAGGVEISEKEIVSDATLMALDGVDGKEYWLGWDNFYVITRYNHSALYAMAVFQLAEGIQAEAAGD